MSSERFEVIFTPYSERHYIKRFEKKYHEKWTLTRQALVERIHTLRFNAFQRRLSSLDTYNHFTFGINALSAPIICLNLILYSLPSGDISVVLASVSLFLTGCLLSFFVSFAVGWVMGRVV